MACETWELRYTPLGAAVMPAMLVAFVLLITGCSGKIAVVKAAPAEMQPIDRIVSANGKVELIEAFQARATVPGQVQQLSVKIGDKVRPGQELIRLNDADARMRLANATMAVASAQNGVRVLQSGGNADELLGQKADMTAARVTLQQAQTRLATLQQLQSRGASSANEVSAAQVQVTEAQNRINALQARQTGRFSSADITLQRDQVTRSRAELASAASDLANFDIKSPISGTVYAVQTMVYAQVNPGQDLVNVADLSKIRVRAFFDEPEIGRLAVGQSVRITWEAKPERAWHGHIAAMPTSITNYGTRNVGECLIAVDDSTGDLIPNVNVTLYVTTAHRDDVLTIPHEALRTQGVNKYVYKIVDGKLQKAAVQVDVVSQTLVQITGGLQRGDLVALVPVNDVELKNGIAVKVQP